MPTPPRLLALAASAALLVAVSACSGPTVGLAPGLTARMDASGATLDKTTALNLVNDLRRSRGAPALSRDPSLEAAAQAAANAYASSSRSPNKPDAAEAILTSAGYVTFAETFSGWRGSEKDTRALTNAGMRRAGLAVAYDGGSEYGAHWVLLMAP